MLRCYACQHMAHAWLQHIESSLLQLHHATTAAPPPHPTLLACRRALREYDARVAAEGAYSDEELPEELIDSLEREAGEDRKCFAVGGCRPAGWLAGAGQRVVLT